MRTGRFLALSLMSMMMAQAAWSDATRYIITFKNESSYRAASMDLKRSKKLEQLGLAFPNASHEFRLLSANTKVVGALDQLQMMIVESADERVMQQLSQHPAIAEVEAEIFYPAPKPMVGALGKLKPAEGCTVETPWGIGAVKAPAAWETTKGENARVVILDTGIDSDHTDLKSRIEKARDFTGGNSPKDTIGHGTHVAGTIAGDGTCLVGVAPKAKLLAGKVCEDRGCSSAAIIAGIDWGVQEKASVISMSLGGPLSTPSQQRAVERAEQAGVNVVAASGNDGVRRISYPAAYPSVVAVGAVQENGGDYKRADFSQYGPGLDIVAPGVDVVSSVPVGAGRVSSVTVDFGDGKSTRVKSTSFAGAPQVENPVSGQFVFAGLGKPEDIQKVNVRGKFALIQRGEIAFKDKVVNAMNAGATGVVIFNNADGLARGSIGEDGAIRIPVAMIEKSVGERIKAELGRGGSASASIVTESTDYDSYDGTSMATPHVAGVVALIRSANSKLTPAEVREVLGRTANTLGNSDEYGSGMVNAEAAVERARSSGRAK